MRGHSQNTNEPYFEDESFDLMKFLLNSADKAFENNMEELAIHLYYSAFELSKAGVGEPSEEVLRGMRNAWQIACRLSDRSTAEAIHASLSPYNTPEQIESGVYELQRLAMDQLASLGVPEEVLEKVTSSISLFEDQLGDERGIIDVFLAEGDLAQFVDGDDTALDPQALGKVFQSPNEARIVPLIGGKNNNLASNDSNDDDLSLLKKDSSLTNGASGLQGSAQAPEPQIANQKKQVAFGYNRIKGFDNLIDNMKRYGIVSPEDEEAIEFLNEMAKYHGVDHASAFEPILFYGNSREDVSEFCYATAEQLGFPVLLIKIFMNDDGTGSVRLQGQFKRSFFGPPDPTDIPTPCVFIIENIDMLNALLINAESDNIFVSGPAGTQTQTSMCEELLNYMEMILEKPGVCLIMTSGENFDFDPELFEVFGDVEAIEVSEPDAFERDGMWALVSEKHPSFKGVRISKLIKLSEGLSRQSILDIGEAVVAKAYRESVANQKSSKVKLVDVLMEMKEYFEIEDSSFQKIEDAIVKEFSKEIRDDLF